MANIDKELSHIKNAIYGREVRGSIHDGIKKINTESEGSRTIANNNKQRQDTIEQQFDDLQRNYSEGTPSTAEVVAARTNTDTSENYSTIGRRMDEEYKKVTSQLNETGNDLNSRGINIEIFGAVGDFDEESETGTNNHLAFVAAAEYAKENDVPIYVPDKNYMVDGLLEIYSGLIGDGRIYFPNTNPNARLIISSNKEPIELNKEGLSGLIEGSTRIVGLKTTHNNHLLIIESNEVLIDRYNPPSNVSYTKNEVAVVTNGNGNIIPALDFTYDVSQIRSVRLAPPEKSIIIGVDIIGFGSEMKNSSLITCTRSNVTFDGVTANSLRSTSFRTIVNINNCALTTFNNVKLSNADYEGFGYGISIGNTAFTNIINSHISDCRHTVSGRHAKAVYVSGGSYHGDIDSHWGSNFVFDNITALASFFYAGKDITIENCDITTSYSDLLRVRTDTPEVSGKVVIKNNRIKTADDATHLKIFNHASINYPNPDYFGRRLKSPDMIEFVGNIIDVPVSKDVWTVNYGLVDYKQHAPKNILVANNTLKNGNRIYNNVDTTDEMTGNTLIVFENQEMNGNDANTTNIRARDLKTTTNPRRIELVFNNCKNLSTRLDPTAIEKAYYSDCLINYAGRTSIGNTEGSGGQGQWFNNCHFNSANIDFPYGKLHFVTCVFSGMIQVVERDIQLMVGCYKLPGTVGFPSNIDLMSYVKAL